ncbi:MAG: DUF1015 domain-containing protein [Clostridiales bacterium]|nr:DUF1015 domain-containing protein [Clostridiales bacterium]
MDKNVIKADNILLPSKANMSTWACIACDQFTSEPEYWKTLEKFVGSDKSTLNLTLPEIYLEDDADARISKINKNIKDYLDKGVLKSLQKGFILTVRKTPFVQRRIGLMVAIDLEEYEYLPKSTSLIRATEGTIEERIPPRLKIRKNADVEFPHVMVLFDDENRNITEDLYNNRDKYKKVYDFELNMGGGHIEGYFIDDYNAVIQKFYRLLDTNRLIKKYGKDDKFLFAVGDGNHSLATAKTHWNNIKETLDESQKDNHPARYALVELVNVYDEGIYFEPIHRYVYGVDKETFIKGLEGVDGGKVRIIDGENELNKNGCNDLPSGIRAIDCYIKQYIEKHGGVVDYVHGDDNIKKLVSDRKDAVGILFDKLDKGDLFRYVSKNGAFPRKTFSMGEGVEKRYYLEGRKITND